MGRAEPYADPKDLPEEEVAGYSRSQRDAFMHAWNRAASKGKKEETALQEAHFAAKQESGEGSKGGRRPP